MRWRTVPRASLEGMRSTAHLHLRMSKLSPRDYITAKGVRQHNLKGFDLVLPKRRMVVVTGPSGSGKSSLAFDTIFAEGQRRYMESLSSYARQFLERMDKPDVDFITGLAPAIAIEQRVLAKNPRSTVATQTEIYDHLRMLYAQIGRTVSPISGKVVSEDSPRSVANTLASDLDDGTKFFVTFPVPEHDTDALVVQTLLERGFHRILFSLNGTISLVDLTDSNPSAFPTKLSDAFVVLDRLVVRKDNESAISRIADSIESAFREGNGYCSVLVPSPDSRDVLASKHDFSRWLERDGMTFQSPHPKLFSFNSPLGACPSCNGHGRSRGIDPDLVVPDPNLSLAKGAIKPFECSIGKNAKVRMLKCARRYHINTTVPYHQLTKQERLVLWRGDQSYEGILDFFEGLKKYYYRDGYRFHHARFTGFGICFECNGSRLRQEAHYVKVGDRHIGQVVQMTIREAKEFFDHLELTRYEQDAGGILLHEIRKRLRFLVDVGLDYITLGRLSETLSGGESQRIRLATALGSALVGALYVLDEPTIGLHPRDTLRLVDILKRMRDLGNTVIVVEHDPDVIRSADHIIDLGPESGSRGGELIFQGSIDQMLEDNASRTGAYLSGNKSIPVPKKRRTPDWSRAVEITGAHANNLKNLNVRIPLERITCITGVSGSGKSSLVEEVLYKGLIKKLDQGYGISDPPACQSIQIHSSVNYVQIIDQSPIGKSTRSNPVTYVKAFDLIRSIYANTDQARLHNHPPGFFSFNIPGGRCPECEGEGSVKVEMQFLADLYLPCEECDGTRYSEAALNILYKGKNIHDVLNLSVDEAIEFFGDESRLCRMLLPLQTIGLGYLKLGQPAPTLSGGEAQRIKLARYLVDSPNYRVFYIFDEPTTGLHFVDVEKLIIAFQQLIDAKHTVVIIEHNLDTIKCADHIIDLGPEGGVNGGRIVASGTPEEVAMVKESHTGRFLVPLVLPETP